MKKKKYKTSMVTAMLTSAVVILSACGGDGASTDTSASPTPVASPGASATAPAKTEFTFTMNMDNPTITWDNEVANEIKKRTGATIKWDIITGDFRTKMNVWLAAGDYPEVINIHDNTLQSYIKANAVLDLEPLIKEHAPNIMKAYNNDLKNLRHTDGKVYGLLQPPTQKVDDMNKAGFFAIQAAVLKEAGYPEIKTLDDIRNVVVDYMKKYPEIGGGKTIGFSNYGAANQLYNIFDTAARTYAGFAATANHVIDDQSNAKLRYFVPGYTDLFKYFNKLNAEGLFDPESLVQTPEQFTVKCNQGRVLVIFGGGGECTTTLAKNNMADRSYIKFDIVAPGKTKFEVTPRLDANRGGDMWLSITKNAKDPVRLIQFYDDMHKLENQILVGWGIEGKYYKVENGKRVVTDWFMNEYNNNTAFYEALGMGYARPLSTNYARGFTLSDGDFARFDNSVSFLSRNMNAVQSETLAKYNAKTFSDLLVKSTVKDYQFTGLVATDEMKKFTTESIAEWGKALQKFIIEKDPSKLDGHWQDFEKKLKEKGLDKHDEEMNRLFKEKLAKLNK
jgi:putative aldouronate transport system substrate-binding protein